MNIDQQDDSISIEMAKILAVASRWFKWGMKEAIHIRMAAAPLLKRDRGCYSLSLWCETIC